MIISTAVQAQTPRDDVIDRLDPLVQSILPAPAELELLKDDYFGLPEGPLWWPENGNGSLLFSDMPANVVYRWRQDTGLSVFLERSGFSGTDLANISVFPNGRLYIAAVGSNGLARDPEGRLVLCQMGDRAVVRVESDGTRTTLADQFQGKRLNSPNDIVIKSNGSIYFTDPPAGIRGGVNSPVKELPFSGVFLIRDGELQLLDKDPEGGTPNGIALSPDEKHLYVINSASSKIVRYTIQPDDTIADREVIVDMSGDRTPGIADGMKVDQKGNIYSTGPGGVWIISPEGKHIGTIRLPGGRPPYDVGETGVNLAFGDSDLRGLYIVTRRSLYRIRLAVPGAKRY